MYGIGSSGQGTDARHALRVDGLRKVFAGLERPAVDRVSFTVEPGELFALLGPSGCGKTTTLRLIAGFERPDGGAIDLGQRALCGPDAWVPPEHRGMGFVFQDYALFPHLSVIDNVAFGLSHLPRRERRPRALEALELVGLADAAKRSTTTLSGGQQQRAALARALAPRPSLVLLDEPFNSLDAGLRTQTRHEVRDLLHRTGAAAILVTHDQEEALSIADRIGVMRDGHLLQVDSPERLYQRPSCAFVARFLGATNLLTGTARGGVGQIPALGELQLDRAQEGEVLLSLRPEDLELCNCGDEGPPPDSDCQRDGVGCILSRQFKGHDVTYVLRLGDQQVTVQALADCPFRVGETVRLQQKKPAVVLGDKPGTFTIGGAA